jgi:2-oxoglutarate ferredoxin oxidoreductase subunit beta
MTGGQYSPTTPKGYFASTAPYGHIDPSFDIVELAMGAGATYVARSTVANPREMEKVIQEGLKNKGFSLIEVVSNCHERFGKRNKMKSPYEMIEWIRSRSVSKVKAESMEAEEREGKIITGIFRQETRPEYVETYDELVLKKARGGI